MSCHCHVLISRLSVAPHLSAAAICPTKNFPGQSHPGIYHALFFEIPCSCEQCSYDPALLGWCKRQQPRVSLEQNTACTRNAAMCTKYVHQVCAPTTCTMYAHKVCALRMCTKYKNMCTLHRSAHLLVDLMSTRYAAFPPEVQATCTKPGVVGLFLPQCTS